MPKEHIAFTDKEQFILSYYRDARLSSWRRAALLQGAWIVVSGAFLVASWWQHDLARGFVAYLILLWRAGASIWRAREYSDVFRDIVSKYDARIEELASPPA